MDPDIKTVGNLVWLSECGMCGNLSMSGHWGCPKWALVPVHSMTAGVDPAGLDREVSLAKTQEFCTQCQNFNLTFLELFLCT